MNHIGIWDLAFTAKVTDQLQATFTTGGSTKGIFDGKVGDESYSGLSFKFSLWLNKDSKYLKLKFYYIYLDPEW